jgi:hypothetical protein
MKGQTTVQLLVLSAFVVSLKIGISEAVREYRPGDDISKAEILELKTMLSSMQGSLITSVSLIQDQIDQFGNSYLEKVDSRLASHDTRLASIDENVKNVQERAHVWDSFQHHATSWADLMTTVESKIDHISRAQAEQHTLVGGQLSRLQSAVSLGLEQINERVTIMENKLRTFSSKQDETLQSLETVKEKVVDIHKTSASSGNSRKHSSRVLDGNPSQRNKSTNSSHSSHHLCTEVKQTIRTMDNKIDYMYKRINIGSDAVKDLPFTNDSNAVLEDGSDYFMDSIDHDFEGIMLNKPIRSSPHTQSTSSSHT